MGRLIAITCPSRAVYDRVTASGAIVALRVTLSFYLRQSQRQHLLQEGANAGTPFGVSKSVQFGRESFLRIKARL
jgi:hypothetical protein